MDRVVVASKASTSQLQASIVEERVLNDGHTYNFRIHKASQLSKKHRAAIWDMFEQNMRQSYIDSSFGWDPKEKREELFHKDSRYILAHTIAQDSSPVLAAYGSFRFDMEEMMSGDEEPVLYCYELQVSKDARRAGLGSAVMSDMDALARAWNLDKVMLTCFCANTTALAFYRRIGFTPDAISPSQTPAMGYPPDGSASLDEGEDEEPADYEIMSKVIHSHT